MSIAIITPWCGQPQLLPAYAAATAGALPILIDTREAGTPGDPALIAHAVAAQGVYLREPRRPFSYAAACNLGLAHALVLGATHAVCLNNDITGTPDWLADVARLPDGVLAGPELKQLRTRGQPHLYVAGWCVAATLATWARLGNWDADAYVGCYHEDVDLSWRAARAEIYLQARAWDVHHLGETTTKQTPGATDNHHYNRSVFAARVQAWQEASA